jgi:hypothetical protein
MGTQYTYKKRKSLRHKRNKRKTDKFNKLLNDIEYQKEIFKTTLNKFKQNKL